ncbi:MAG: hypothetical protein RSC66_01260, partial [Comamonas sp.]
VAQRELAKAVAQGHDLQEFGHYLPQLVVQEHIAQRAFMQAKNAGVSMRHTGIEKCQTGRALGL